MKKPTFKKGFTLIEAIIYTALLSLLVTGFIRFASVSFAQASKLMDRIDEAWNEKGGFIATSSVLVLAMGLLAFSSVAMISSYLFSDYVTKHELRIQARLNVESCLDTVQLMFEKDIFLEGKMDISDLNCTAEMTNHKNGSLSIRARAIYGGVTWKGEREYTSRYPL